MERFSHPPPGPAHDRFAPLKAAACYGLAAAAWIFVSDQLLLEFVHDTDRLSHLQTAKGWSFVLVSALLLYALVRHYLKGMQRRADQLRISEESFRSVFLTAAAGMVVLRLDGSIIHANPAFCRFLGYREEELAGRTIAELTHPHDRELTVQSYQMLSTGREESIHYEKRYLTRDGRTVWGHASVACLFGENEREPYCIGLVQNITERKAAEAALQQSNRELEAFAYTVSHDLRTPLTPIIGYADFLAENSGGRLNDQEMQCLAEIKSAGMRMTTVMEELLLLAKVGNIERPPAPIDLDAVVNETVRLRAAEIERSGARVTYGGLPAARVPQTLLTQVIDNLLGNALRYGCSDGGAIEIGGERSDGRIRLYVRDHGPGIPLEERGRIFELFYRCSNGKGIQGTGIGLATVQKIARLYGGSAWVDETPGGGCTFWVELVDSADGSQ